MIKLNKALITVLAGGALAGVAPVSPAHAIVWNNGGSTCTASSGCTTPSWQDWREARSWKKEGAVPDNICAYFYDGSIFVPTTYSGRCPGGVNFVRNCYYGGGTKTASFAGSGPWQLDPRAATPGDMTSC